MLRFLQGVFDFIIGNPVPIAPKVKPTITEFDPAPPVVLKPTVTIPVIPVPIVKTMPEKIYDFAKSCMGKDIAATQNELGCAESVSYVFNHVGVKNFPKTGYLGTADFFKWLKANAQQVTIPSPGDVIISPTGTSTKGAAHGHIGIVAMHGILSNNSLNGLWQEYYTQGTWQQYYRLKLGFPVLFYRIP